MSSNFNPVVLVSAAVTMRRMMLAAATGHTHFINGRVSAEKALTFVRKFEGLWELNLNKTQRYRRRQVGIATFMLFMYPVDQSQDLDWFLFRTEGRHPHIAAERWRAFSGRKGERLEWRGYELLRLPYTRHDFEQFEGRLRKTGSWTWRMTRETREGFKKRARSCANACRRAKSTTASMRQLLQSLERVPGFRAARDQVSELRQYINIWRLRVGLKPVEFKKPILYMNFRDCEKYPLSMLVHRVLSGEDAWFPPPRRGKPTGQITLIRKKRRRKNSAGTAKTTSSKQEK